MNVNFNEKLGTKIRDSRKNIGMTMKELGEKVNLSEGTISRYEKGEIKGVTIDLLKNIAKALNISEAYLMGWEEDVLQFNSPKALLRNNQPVPLIGNIAAGTPILAEENIEGYFNIDESIRADFCLRVRGDSMIEANIFNGDIAFFKQSPVLENGEIGAVVINEEATLKRFYKYDNSLLLKAENIKYEPILVSSENEVRIAGKLIAVLHLTDL